MVIYLACLLPDTSSGYRATGGLPLNVTLLAAGGVYLPDMSPCQTVSSYLTRFALTKPEPGGIVSVALSLSFRPVAVSDRPVLCCPDFPLVTEKLPATIC